jgi:tetratricopeptide (TPR) repeat protein
MSESKKPRRKAEDIPIPDRAAIEVYAAEVSADRRSAALSEAQDMVYDAWEKLTSHSRRVRARKAIAVSPLCADAHSLLASETMDSDEQRELYERAVLAGELAIGRKDFAELAGHFWLAFETRPYMRARQGLALMLAAMGDAPAAIAHFRAMLELNPGDNQGIRYLLLRCLLSLDDLPAIKSLLASHPEEGSTEWAYTNLLIAYRDGEGSRHTTQKRLHEALSANVYVPALLAERARPVFSDSGYLTIGGEEEASDYSIHHGRFWRETPGAIEWLVSAIATPSQPKRRPGKSVH